MDNLIIKKEDGKFWHVHNGNVSQRFAISNFQISLDGNKFAIIQNDGAMRYTYLVQNITIDDEGNTFTTTDPVALWNKLTQMNYTPFVIGGASSLNLSQYNNDVPFATEASLNNKNQFVTVTTALDAGGVANVISAANALPNYAVDKSHILYIENQGSKTINGVIVPYIERYTTVEVGKGNYGVGGTQLTAQSIKLSYSSLITAADVADSPGNQIITIPTLGGMEIWDYVTTANPPFDIQDESVRMFQITDTEESYIFTAAGGIYGGGELPADESFFVLIPNEQQPLVNTSGLNNDGENGVNPYFTSVNMNELIDEQTTIADGDLIVTNDSNDSDLVKKISVINLWISNLRTKVLSEIATAIMAFQIAEVDTKIPLSQRAAANGVATLGADSKIPNNQLPALAITDTFVRNSQTAMLLTSTAETGDVCVRTDINKTFILTATPPSTLSNWQEMLTPTDAVSSVDGQTGNVNLSGVYNPLITGTFPFLPRYKSGGGVESTTVKVVDGDNTTPSYLQLDGTYRVGGSLWDKLKFYLFFFGGESYGFGLGDISNLQYWAGSASTGKHEFYTSRTKRVLIDDAGEFSVFNLANATGKFTYADDAGKLKKSSLNEVTTAIISTKILVSKIGTDGGFENESYTVNSHQNVWRLRDAPEFGIGFYQGLSLDGTGLDGFGFHFGNRNEPKFRFRADGRLQLTAANDANQAVTLEQLQLEIDNLVDDVEANFTPLIVPTAVNPSDAVNLQQFQENLASFSIHNPTIIDLDLAYLETNYPDARLGFEVLCPYIPIKPSVYKKMDAGVWHRIYTENIT